MVPCLGHLNFGTNGTNQPDPHHLVGQGAGRLWTRSCGVPSGVCLYPLLSANTFSVISSFKVVVNLPPTH